MATRGEGQYVTFHILPEILFPTPGGVKRNGSAEPSCILASFFFPCAACPKVKVCTLRRCTPDEQTGKSKGPSRMGILDIESSWRAHFVQEV
jgi:hypothetical protein